MSIHTQELTDIISAETQEINTGGTVSSPVTSAPNVLFEPEMRERQLMSNHERKMAVLNLLAAMCEDIGPSCLNDTQQTLQFIKV